MIASSPCCNSGDIEKAMNKTQIYDFDNKLSLFNAIFIQDKD